MEAALTALISVGGSILIYLIAKPWLDERLRASVRHEYDLKFERARSEMHAELEKAAEQRRDISRSLDATASAATNSFLASHRAAIDRRLDAVDRLWTELLRLQKLMPTAVFTQDLLVPSEFQEFLTKPNLRQLVEAHDMQAWTTEAIGQSDIERTRPFVSDYLYSIAFIYRMIIGRVTYLLRSGFEKGQISDWGEDKPILDVLGQVLTRQELEQFRSRNGARLGLVLGFLNNKFIGHARKLISGEEAADFGAELSRKIHELSWARSPFYES